MTEKARSSRDFRCSECNRLLARHRATYLEIKCPRCRRVNSLSAESAPSERRRASAFGAFNGAKPQ
ncbi:Com family DNA-binding transcriptional regulator (plasmid) [Microbulbifer sp. ANSA001]|uniref:Com family DNA-binding transcriptional regulator n=1 Tax=Microbulbifer sp. ANSA001 TaxID=3243358 RepID=UPI0040437788